MRKLLFYNLGWKLLSLALALILWFAVVGAPEYFLDTLPGTIRSLLGG